MAQFVAVGVQTSVAAVFAPEMVAEFGWTRTQFLRRRLTRQGILMVVGFLIGPRIDRFGARPIMLTAAAVCIPSLILMSQVDHYWQYLIVRGVFLLTSASVAGFLVLSIAVSKWFVVKRGQALGWTSMGVSMAGLVWPSFAVAALIDPLGWRTAWIVLSAFPRRHPDPLGAAHAPPARRLRNAPRRRPDPAHARPDQGCPARR